LYHKINPSSEPNKIEMGTEFGELHRSLSKPAFERALQKLLPGTLVDDFVIRQSCYAIHILNVPSRGTIGYSIAEMAAKNFALKN